MKAEWQVKTLGESCFIARGGSPRPIQEFLTNDANGVNWIKISDATASDKFIFKTKEKIKPSGISRSRLVKEGDFILSNSMSFGRPYVMKTSGCIHDGWLVLSEYEKYFDQGFLYHLLGSPVVFEQFNNLAAGSTVRNLNIELASRVILPIPPLEQQRRIVATLDQAFKGIAKARANAEQNLKNARALFESHLQSVFTQRGEGWIEKSLSDIGITKTGSTPKAITKGSYGNFIPFIKPADFKKNGSLNYDNDGLSELGADGARKISAGSVLMVCIGATIGKCGFCDREITTNQQINSLTPKDIDGKFVYYQMLTNNFQNRVLHSSGQATLPIINKSKWSALKIGYPVSISEQVSISDKLDLLLIETQRLEAIYQRKIALLDELKKSLLQQAFAGEL
jgi:type I restriction enzyme, S subunit